MKRPNIIYAAIPAGVLLLAVTPVWGAEPQALREQALAIFGVLPDKMPGSENDTPARIELGRKLYFDNRLSVNDSQSCNTCHRLDENRGGVDNEPTSLGAHGKRGDRNAPTTLNAGFHIAQFWDGRAKDLKEQAKGPVLNPVEMAMPSEEAVVKKLSNVPEYRDLFAKAFPGEDPAITYDNMAEAIAAFERTLITRDRFDDFLKGDDQALTAQELKGLETFLNLGCVTCHMGPVIGGNTYQKIGLINPYENTKDKGRYEVTKDEADLYKFKVPTLRNVALTAPYFHDGALKTLEGAIWKMGWMQLGRELNNDEVQAIAAFLRALTDKERAAQ